jgi:hypothetical protein
MTMAHSDVLWKFTDHAFDESAEMRWQESQRGEGDNVDVGSRTETDMQNELFESLGNPF